MTSLDTNSNLTRRSLFQLAGAALAGAATTGAATAPRKTRNLLLVTTDGLRWQDVFRGAEVDRLKNAKDWEDLKKRFLADTPEARRQALMPFLWSHVAQHGQLYGNHDKGSEAYVTNGKNFSYPGYNELLTGHPDDRIDSNDKVPNPNVNVLEFLNRQPTFKNKIAAFGAWDCFPSILNAERSGLLVNAGYDPLKALPGNPRVALLNRLKEETGIWDGEPLDAPVFHLAMEYLKAEKPRVLYLAFGDTDEWAHHGNYPLYLAAAHRVDQYVKQAWETMQSMPEYHGTTSLVMTVDHGRGETGDGWQGHGQKIPESKYIWCGAMGPDTKPQGERSNVPAVTQSQIAATVATLLGQDYKTFEPKAAPPISDVVS